MGLRLCDGCVRALLVCFFESQNAVKPSNRRRTTSRVCVVVSANSLNREVISKVTFVQNPGYFALALGRH